jgi:hypothetical protein
MLGLIASLFKKLKEIKKNILVQDIPCSKPDLIFIFLLLFVLFFNFG